MTYRVALEEPHKRRRRASSVTPRLKQVAGGHPYRVLAVVCPGQGSQTAGFLTPWLELPGVRDRLIAFSEAAATDLIAHGTVSDAETIRDTAVAQPLIVASSLVAFEALTGLPLPAGPAVGATAGHSVGEFAAAAVAGVLTAEQALLLVAERGRAMAAAGAVTPTGMSAVLGGDADEVIATLGRHGLTPANLNGAGQVVAAGTLEQLKALAAEPPARTRVIPLRVAGAFHTHHMAPAVDALAEAAAGIAPKDPVIPLLTNADGTVVPHGQQALQHLVMQVSNPVRWDLCLATLRELGVSALLELPPAGTLANLAKRALPGVAVLAVKTPDDLDPARALVAEYAFEDMLNPELTGGSR
jgi:[acyl-carrier-protein] S-malonyltransferase